MTVAPVRICAWAVMPNSRIKTRFVVIHVMTHMLAVSATSITAGILRFNHDAMVISGIITGSAFIACGILLTLPYR